MERGPCNILTRDEESLLVSSVLFLFFQLWCFLFFPSLSTPTNPSSSPPPPALLFLSFPFLAVPLSRSLTVQPPPHLKWTQQGENIAFWLAGLSGSEAFRRSLRVCVRICVSLPSHHSTVPTATLGVLSESVSTYLLSFRLICRALNEHLSLSSLFYLAEKR